MAIDHHKVVADILINQLLHFSRNRTKVVQTMVPAKIIRTKQTTREDKMYLFSLEFTEITSEESLFKS